ncbi:unnamed protein product [Fusarium graminearum]|uniref:peptidyl-tRNA hydrolase n=1 Tax=Gibberella zeae TaxID=5518 RepID=A0A679P007_GIBZA|nr:unnamed protein product [Fusarium graminearum]CAG1966292.1 unnamed protein product [Fusarium graminearum]CAG1981088.1 unnamed protein product [Fusarium graminearum]CZS77597.1 unnamed protein product [Fusarium graminearum]
MFNPRFLVVSLGNPLPKYQSLHSAGHFALNGLANFLRNPSFQEKTFGGQSCLVSQGPKYTLVQSPTLMNISGRFVARAWNDMIKQQDPSSLSLIIVHDELEAKKGAVSLRAWDRSPRGHNGIKDVKNKLSQDKYPTSPFVRIAVGIGRPSDGERDRNTVSDYVLNRISNEERRIFEEDEVPRMVAQQLIQVEKEWKAELEQL